MISSIFKRLFGSTEHEPKKSGWFVDRVGQVWLLQHDPEDPIVLIFLNSWRSDDDGGDDVLYHDALCFDSDDCLSLHGGAWNESENLPFERREPWTRLA